MVISSCDVGCLHQGPWKVRGGLPWSQCTCLIPSIDSPGAQGREAQAAWLDRALETSGS